MMLRRFFDWLQGKPKYKPLASVDFYSKEREATELRYMMVMNNFHKAFKKAKRKQQIRDFHKRKRNIK